MANKTDVITALGLLHIAYTEFDLSDAAIELYHQILCDISGRGLMAAANQYLADPDSKYFPKPGQLRGIALKLALPRKITGLEAWGEVQAQVSRCGAYAFIHPNAKKPIFSSSVIKLVVDAIGWQRCCDMPLNDIVRSQFIKQFDELMAEIMQDDKLLPDVRAFQNSQSIRFLTSSIDQAIDENKKNDELEM